METQHPALRRLIDRPRLLLALAILFWAGNFVVGRAVRADVPPFGLAFWRWFGALVLIMPFAWAPLWRARAVVRAHWPMLVVLAVLGVATFNTLVYIGLHATTAINGVLLQSTMPVVIVVMSWVLLRDTVSARQAAGIALSLAGALYVIARGEPAALLALAPNRGDALILVAVVCYAAYSVLLKRAPAMPALAFLAVTFAIGAALLLPFYAWESTNGAPVRLHATSLAAIGYVAVFPSVLAFLCFNRGVALIGANRAGVFFHLMPLFGSLLAVAFLGERLRLYHALGAALILAGIALASRRRLNP